MPDALDTCVDCSILTEGTRCRQCWAKDLLRQDAETGRALAGFQQHGFLRHNADDAESAAAVAEAERIMGIA